MIGELLAQRWSPQQISLHLRQRFPDEPAMWLCPESIYQALYQPGSTLMRPSPLAPQHRSPLRTGRDHRRAQQRTDRRRPRFEQPMRSIHERPFPPEDRAEAHRETTSARPLSLARNVPAESDSRTGTHDEPMSEKSSAPDLGCSKVPDEFAENPRLVWVRHAAMDTLLHSDGEHLCPRQVVERDLAEFALVDVDGVYAGRRGHLIRDRQHAVEAVLSGHVEVRLDLRPLELRRSGLHLDQASPRSRPSACLKHTVGVDRPFLGLEGDLDECRQLAGRGTQATDHRLAKLSNRPHHRKQRGRRSSFGLFGAIDSARRNQPCLLPVLVGHRYTPLLPVLPPAYDRLPASLARARRSNGHLVRRCGNDRRRQLPHGPAIRHRHSVRCRPSPSGHDELLHVSLVPVRQRQ